MTVNAKPPQPPTKSPNPLLACLLLPVILCIAAGIVYFAMQVFGINSSSLPIIQTGGIASFLGSLLWLLVKTVVSTVLFGFGALVFARGIQWPVLNWLDTRMLPTDEKIAKRQQKMQKGSWWINLVNRLVPEERGEQQELPKPPGLYETKEGEVFLGMHFPDWWAITVWNTGKSSFGVMVMAAGFAFSVGFVGLLVNISFTVRLLPYIVLAMTAFVTVTYLYLANEWSRLNTMWLIFSDTLIYLKGKFSLLGLLLGWGSDVIQKETPVKPLADTDMAVNPHDIDPTIQVSWFYETYLEWLATVRGVTTVILRNYFQNAEDKFLSFSRVSDIRSQMGKAVMVSTGRKAFQMGLQSEAAKIAVGAGQTDWSYERGQEAARALIATRSGHLKKPARINLFSLKQMKLRGEIPADLTDSLESKPGTVVVVEAPVTPAGPSVDQDTSIDPSGRPTKFSGKRLPPAS